MSAATPEPQPLSTWAVVEAMGHRTLIGRVTEAAIAGKPMLHVATIAGGEHYLPPESLYCLTPCTREQAERASSRHWGGLPPALAALTAGTGEGPEEDDEDDLRRVRFRPVDEADDDWDDEPDGAGLTEARRGD